MTTTLLAFAFVIPQALAPEERVELKYRRFLTGQVRHIWGREQAVSIFAGQIRQESNWNPSAKSRYAGGLSQFTPDTAEPTRFREHKGSNTKEGSFYALKFVTNSGSEACVYTSLVQHANLNTISGLIPLSKVAGRTVTFGAWVKSGSSSTCVYISDTERGYTTSQHASSKAHSGGSAYEWLETTYTFGTSPSAVAFGIYGAANQTIYISQPMLAFGSYIGEGNYAPMPNEVIPLESNLKLLNDISVSTSATTNYNIETSSNGKLPKNVSAFAGVFSAQPSATPTGGHSIQLDGGSSSSVALTLDPQFLATGVNTEFRPCAVEAEAGDFRVSTSSGASWNNVELQARSVRLN